jgi:DNA-binding transcriptional LysR family regulator
MASILQADGLDIASVRLFLDVVELGSVSKAAVRQGLAQPSATARLQKLERQLRVQLLDRGPTGSRATAAGLRLAPACAELVSAALALVDRAELVLDDQRRLVVATTRHVADHFLPGWIAATDLDDVRVDLVEGDTLAVAQAVRSGDAVVGFAEGPAAPIGLRSELVASEEIVPVVGRRHPWYRTRRAVTGSDVVGATLALPRPGSGTLDVVTAALARFDDAPVGDRVEVVSSAAARVSALNGPGVAFLPRCRVAADLASGALAVVPVRDVAIEQPVRVVWRGTRPPARAARRLVDAVLASSRSAHRPPR